MTRRILFAVAASAAMSLSALAQETETPAQPDMAELMKAMGAMMSGGTNAAAVVEPVLDGEGQTAASVALESGFMTSAEAGDLRGEVAVYQLLEKPVRGRFVFVKQEPARGADRTGSGSKPVAPMLFEGIRRYDEFMRAAALAPDGARYRSTGKRPTNVVDEPNTDLVKNVWKRALEGAAPDDLERELPVDSYRVRRLFEHWLGEGSIELADSPGAAAGS